MNVGSLFTGIGGFDLGLERAGMRVVWQCEQNSYRRAVLARHWPGVPCHPDVCALVADPERGRRDGLHERVEARHLAADAELGGQDGANGSSPAGTGGVGGARPVPVSVSCVDVLCGGFPCQDLSLAGKGAGIDGSRSGLWSEFARLVGELRPRYVLVENVPALLARGMGRVLGDLAACGYDAEWDCLSASAFGAPHRRDRIWVVAYPAVSTNGAEVYGGEADWPHTSRPASGVGRPGNGRGAQDTRRPVHDPLRGRHGPSEGEVQAGRDGPEHAGWWELEPDVGRVAHGVPNRVDRLAALGDALVPQIAEWIGRRLMAYELRAQRETGG